MLHLRYSTKVCVKFDSIYCIFFFDELCDTSVTPYVTLEDTANLDNGQQAQVYKTKKITI